MTPRVSHGQAGWLGGAAPLLDRRARQSWADRLPARFTTGALWLGSASLLGPAKLAGLLLVGGLLAPGLVWIDRRRPPQQPLGATSFTLPPLPAAGLSRAAAAEQLQISETQLFRARHANLCTVHHDAQGRIVNVQVHPPALPLPLPSPDAHPVG